MRGNLNKMSDVKSELGVDLQMIDEEALNLAWRKYYSFFVRPQCGVSYSATV